MSILWSLMLMLLQIFFSSANSRNNIILSLSRRPSTNSNPLETLKRHAAASLARAQNHHLLKRNVKVPLHPSSFSEYIVNLSFGTPPQTLPFIVDTGSSLTWFPCTYQKYKYTCTNCHFPGVDPAHIPTFITKKSSSSKIVPCQSRQCEWLFPGLQCKKTQNLCGYIMGYGTGNTTGLLLNETLALGGSVVVDNLTVGCSISSDFWPEGIVGFGRDPESLPSQMGLKSFSYCMVSHAFDGNPSASSDLVLTTTSSNDNKGAAKLNYTPFANTLDYYVKMQSITVGGVDLKVPAKYLEPDAKGYSGTVMDSGTTFTVMKKPVFDLVFEEFQRQVGKKYTVDKSVQNHTGLRPCYKVPAVVGKNKTVELPQLTFNFKGGVEMIFPLSNYFSYADKQRSVVCMTIMSLGDQLGLAPAIILGNYLQQDYYMEYDLENNRLGIRQQNCK